MTNIDIPFLDQLLAEEDGGPGLEDRIHMAEQARGLSRDTSRQLDSVFLDQIFELRYGLKKAQAAQEELRQIHDKLTATPWYPGVFVQEVETSLGLRAVVAQGSSRSVVEFAREVAHDSLGCGDEVFLSSERNVIMGKSPRGVPRCGEIATFDRTTGDNRIVLRRRDEEVVVDAAAVLNDLELKSGDLVRYDPSMWMAFEKFERTRGEDRFLEKTPEESFEDIGGLNAQIEKLKLSIWLRYCHKKIVEKYGLRRKGSVLLVGPAGTGKTMIARALAHWMGDLSKSRRSCFMNIKPAGLHTMWHGQSEANYREAFRVARQAGEEYPDVPVIMFFDEIDSIGSARGQSFTRIDDKVLTAFMAELDGLEARGNILVVAATNRLEALDPALLRPGRLGDLIIDVPRPRMDGARDIFSKYLQADIPYAENGGSKDPQAVRQEIIETSVSRIYSPNGHADLATIKFRDGKQRTVRAADLFSGAVIEKIATAAIERACVREVECGQTGVQARDVLSAIDDEIESMASTLTPANCMKYLEDLPQDMDIVSVVPVVRKVRRPHRYLNLAG